MFANRAITIACLAGGVISIIVSLISGSFIFPLIAAFFFCISLIIWKYGYLFIPLVTKSTNIIEVRGSYEVPKSRDYIIKKTSDGYYVSKFLEIKFYESSMDKDKEEKKTLFESFEKAISSLKYVVRISLMISSLELSSHLDEIKTRRGEIEARKAKEGKMAQDESMRMDRELAYWNRLHDRITQGDRPVELISFASTTAFGLTREEAISKATRQSKELKTILSSSLGCDMRDLTDLDMLKCFEWEYFMPSTQEEVKDTVF